MSNSGGYNVRLKVFVPCDLTKPADAMKTLEALEEAKADPKKIGALLAGDGVEVDDFALTPISRRGARKGASAE